MLTQYEPTNPNLKTRKMVQGRHQVENRSILNYIGFGLAGGGHYCSFTQGYPHPKVASRAETDEPTIPECGFAIVFESECRIG